MSITDAPCRWYYLPSCFRLHRITEGLSWGQKGPLKITCFTSPLQVRPPRARVAQDSAQLGVSKEEDSTASLGNPCQCSVKKYYSTKQILWLASLISYWRCFDFFLARLRLQTSKGFTWLESHTKWYLVLAGISWKPPNIPCFMPVKMYAIVNKSI